MAVLMAQSNLSDPSRPLFKSSSKPLQDDFTERFSQALRDSEAITKAGRDPAETTVSVSTQSPAFPMMKTPSLIGFTNEVDWTTMLAGQHAIHIPSEAIKFGTVGADSGRSRESAGIEALGPAREELVEHVGDLTVNLLDLHSLTRENEKTARLVSGDSNSDPLLPVLIPTPIMPSCYRLLTPPSGSFLIFTSVSRWVGSGSTFVNLDRINPLLRFSRRR